jgi:diacylglycerol kinase (ATP)
MKDRKIMAHKKVLVLINHKSRSGRLHLETVTKYLSERGVEVLNQADHESDTDPNEIILKHRSEADFVIVGGGDGTVNKVLPSLKETQIPMLLLPFGTANNLARTFMIPNDIEACLSLIEKNVIQEVDLGVVNGILFVNVAGLGLSTEVNRKASSWMKRHLGVLAFVITAFQLVTKMKPFRAHITHDKKECQTKSWQISICNGRHYGAGMTIKDDATLEDGILHGLTTEVKHWWEGLYLIPAFMSGKYKKEHEVTLVSGKEITIETKKKFYIDVDGDIQTHTPAKFSVIPRALKLLVNPESVAAPE